MPPIKRGYLVYGILWMDDTHELPCHSWNLIGPLVVSALKLGIVCPRRILNLFFLLFFLLCFSLGNSRVEAQLLTECLSQAEAAFIRSARPARRVSDREGAILCCALILALSIQCELISQTRFEERILHSELYTYILYIQLFVGFNCCWVYGILCTI